MSSVAATTLVSAIATAILRLSHPTPPEPEPVMPRRLQRAAIAAFAEFGRVSRIVATTPATLHDRPGRDLWAVLVRGRFEYTGPLPLLRDTPAPPSGRTGAAVVTDRGEVVRIGLWGANAKQENPVWERVFREDYPAGNP